MKQQMSFLEILPSANAAPVWAALGNQQRGEVVATLARLIAKMVSNRSETAIADEDEDEEKDDE